MKELGFVTVDYLKERASHGEREQFERLLEKVARTDRTPLPEDRLPADVELRPIDGL